MDDADSYLSMLLTGDRDARGNAAYRLARMRGWELSRLGPVLVHPHVSRRVKAIQVLGGVEVLGGESPARRVEAIELLLPSFADDDYPVRYKACNALVRIGSASPDRIAAALSNAEGHHRLALLEVLSRLRDERAVAPLTAMVDAPEASLREGAIRNLRRFRHAPTSGVLLPRLHDTCSSVRREAIRTMGILARPESSFAARPELAFALFDAFFDDGTPPGAGPVGPKWGPGYALHRAVRLCAMDVPGAFEHIIKRARDGDLALRERAAALFPRLPSHGPARDRFLALMEGDDPEVRDTCLQIVAYGSNVADTLPRERALPAILFYVEDDDVRRRVLCARALDQVRGDPRAAEALARLSRDPLTLAALSQWLNGPDPLLRGDARCAVRILRSMELFRPLLEELVQSPTPLYDIEAAVRACARDWGEAFEATLRAALMLPAGQRERLAKVIVHCVRDSSERRERFQSLLENADSVARAGYVEILNESHVMWYSPEEWTIDALLPVLGDAEATVRFAGARTLGQIASVPRAAQALAALAADPATLETLLAWLADPDPRVRLVASETMAVLRRAEFREQEGMVSR